MSYSNVSGELRRQLGQIIDSDGILAGLNLPRCNRDAAGVIATVLQLPETVEEYWQRLPVTDVSDYSAHSNLEDAALVQEIAADDFHCLDLTIVPKY